MIMLRYIFILFVITLLVSCHDDIITPPDEQETVIIEHPQNGIPIVRITTDDGQGITDKENWKAASFALEGCGIAEDIALTPILLKGRGNSTFRHKKKPFTIKFEEKTRLLGMRKSRKWVFLANYLDPSLLRNDITLHIGQLADALEWTPRGEFVDLVFNGTFMGNYLVCEKINISKQHIDIDEMSPQDNDGEAVTGGYLLSFDSTFDEPNRFKTDLEKIPVNILSPNADNITPEQIIYITDYINKIEQLLHAGEYRTLYNEYIDLDSFIDFYLIQLFCGNKDFKVPRSVYVYKKRNGKLFAGPLWDFDYYTYYTTDSGTYRRVWWFKQLLKDEAFCTALKARWKELSPRIEREILNYLESRKDYIHLSAAANFTIFPFDTTKNANVPYKGDFEPNCRLIKENIHQRITFLNDYLK